MTRSNAPREESGGPVKDTVREAAENVVGGLGDEASERLELKRSKRVRNETAGLQGKNPVVRPLSLEWEDFSAYARAEATPLANVANASTTHIYKNATETTRKTNNAALEQPDAPRPRSRTC